jgi:hypothetical protein
MSNITEYQQKYIDSVEGNAHHSAIVIIGELEKNIEKVKGVLTIVNAVLLTTKMRMNTGPEVFVSGSRFIEAKSLEEILGKIVGMLES